MAEKLPPIMSTLVYLERIQAHLDRYFSIENLRAFQSAGGDSFPDNERLKHKVSNAWFRGQAEDWPIIPKVYRHRYDEREILLDARRRASLMQGTPSWDDYVGWYFTLQHHGFPTRLIDWTESSLVGLFFAVAEVFEYESNGKFAGFRPMVWLVHPNALNWTLRGGSIIAPTAMDEGTFGGGSGPDPMWGKDNILAAWSSIATPPQKPIAVTGRYSHIRMQVQRGQFTVHGTERIDLRAYFASSGLSGCGLAVPFHIDPSRAKTILRELQGMGISRSVLFPDLDGLSKEFSDQRRED